MKNSLNWKYVLKNNYNKKTHKDNYKKKISENQQQKPNTIITNLNKNKRE